MIASPGATGTRVLILSAPIGEGHISAAKALERQLQERDEALEVRIVNDFTILGERLASTLERGFERHLARMGWSYHLTYRLFMSLPPARAAAERALHRRGGDHLARYVDEWRPAVVVSTYPVITATLGELRRRGRLAAPACAVVTDLTGLSFWAHRGIDLHLVMYEPSLSHVERIAGPNRARLVRPLVASEHFEPRLRSPVRRTLGLSDQGLLFVVSGGGWAVGDLEGAARAALTVPGARVIVLTGRRPQVRQRLAEALAKESEAEVWGFTDRMADLLSAADALIDTTSGVTCLEARVHGLPTVCYGTSRGHVGANAKALASLPGVFRARSPGELATLLPQISKGVRSAPRDAWAPLPDAAELVLELARGRPTGLCAQRPAGLERSAIAGPGSTGRARSSPDGPAA